MASHDPTLLDAIEDLGSEPFDGVVWRHMFNDNPPELANTRGARWNPPGLAAIYVSLERDTAVAEGQHAIDLQPLRPRAARRVLYEMHLALGQVLRLTPDRLSKVGLTMGHVRDLDFEPCRRVAAEVAWLGWDGMLVPSARHSGLNVVVLLNEMRGSSSFERLSKQELAD